MCLYIVRLFVIIFWYFFIFKFRFKGRNFRSIKGVGLYLNLAFICWGKTVGKFEL